MSITTNPANSGAEAFFIEVGANKIAKLFMATFGQDAAQTLEPEQDGLDELSIEDSQVYKAKLTKWIKNALHAVGDPSYWFCMFCANRSRSPLKHFYHILCAKEDPGRMPIVELVSYRLDMIQHDFDKLPGSFFTWTTHAMKFAGCYSENVGLDGEKLDLTEHCDYNVIQSDGSSMLSTGNMVEAAFALLVVSASSFDRRVVRTFQRLGWVNNSFCWFYHSNKTGWFMLVDDDAADDDNDR